MLVLLHGDGSGTSTGYTVQFNSSDAGVAAEGGLEKLMDVWTGHTMGRHLTWKEVTTLLLLLRWERDPGARWTLHFLLTDNDAMYHNVQKGSSGSPYLHRIIWGIKLFTAAMSLTLEVVHVPDLVISRQGTDPLSRGL